MHFDTLSSVADRLQSGEIPSLELTEKILQRAEKLNPSIHAFNEILAQTAQAEAKASDERRKKGRPWSKIDGVPIAIKDLIDTTPAVCSGGLEHLRAYRPIVDAPVVRALRGAGAIIIGVTETDPGAFSTDTPQVTNPLARNRTAGGSSGGSAAAVAAGMAFAAIGTDTGGSIRVPAACCSLCGFKPTWGRVDATGVRPLARSLDHVGPLARSVSDLIAIQEIIDPSFACSCIGADISKSVIGISEEYFADATADIKMMMSQFMKLLMDNNIQHAGVDLPNCDEIAAFHMVNLSREAADYHSKVFPNDWEYYPDIARDTVAIGLQVTKEQLCEAERLKNRARRVVDNLFENADAIILPTMPIDAPLRSATTYEIGGKIRTKLEATVRYTSLFNQTGHPVVAMPGGLTADGRTFGIQVIGKRDTDASLLCLAREIDQMLPFSIDYRNLNGSVAEHWV